MFSSLILISLVALNVLATPHALNHALHHRAIAARVASPSLAAQNDTSIPLRKRQNAQRCRQRSTTSSSFKPSSSSPPVASSPTSTHAQPTTTQQPPPPAQPSPTSVQPKPQPTTAAPAPSSSSGFLSGPQTGEGTFYTTGLGACGITNTNTDFIAAVSFRLFDIYPGYDGINPNTNPVCGKQVTATYKGKSVTVTITDRCTGCAMTDLDFSPSAFDQLADPSIGRIFGMIWTWV